MTVRGIKLCVPNKATPLFSAILVLTAPTRVTKYGRVVLYAPPSGRKGVRPTVLCTTGLTNVGHVFGTNKMRTVKTVTCNARDVPGMCGVFNPNGRCIATTGRRISLHSMTVSVPTKPSRMTMLTSRATGPIFITTSLLSRTRRNASDRTVLVAADRALLGTIARRIRHRLTRLPQGRVTDHSLTTDGLVLIGGVSRTMRVAGRCTPRRLVVRAGSCVRVDRHVIGTNSIFLNCCSPRDTNSCTSNAGRALPAGNCTGTCDKIDLSDFVHGVAFRRVAPRNVTVVNPTVRIVTTGRRLSTRGGTMSMHLGGWL